MSKRHNHYMEIALTEAKKSPVYIQVGAVLVQRGKIVAVGHNNYTHRGGVSHCASPHWTVHAEIDVLRALRLQQGAQHHQSQQTKSRRKRLCCKGGSFEEYDTVCCQVQTNKSQSPRHVQTMQDVHASYQCGWNSNNCVL